MDRNGDQPIDMDQMRADIIARVGSLDGNLSKMCSGRYMPDSKALHRGQPGGCRNSVTCVCECHDRPRT